MSIPKKSGICMDHTSAHLIEFSADEPTNTNIVSKFTHQVKEHTLSKSENLMHNKEQHQQFEYYKKIGESILNYDEVILFGPTNAKAELYNILKENHHFDKIKIDVQQTNKMSDIEQYVFVKNYFSK